MTSLILGVQFLPDGGAAFEYVDLADQRVNGMQLTRQMLVPGDDPGTADHLEELFGAAKATLQLILAEHEKAEAIDPSTLVQDGDVDDEISPWDNPLERELPEDEA